MNKKYYLVYVAVVAAIYAALCFVFAPISFGPIQFRISELLCILTIDFPFALVGVSLGCFLSNLLIGGLGIIDMVFGTLATVLGCLAAYLLRNKRIKGYPVLSTLMIVISNGVIVGAELAYLEGLFKLFPLYALEVAVGEFVVVSIVGLIIYPKLKEAVDKILAKNN